MRKIKFSFNPINRASLVPFVCDKDKLYVLTKNLNDDCGPFKGDIGVVWYSRPGGRCTDGSEPPIYSDVIFEQAYHDRKDTKYPEYAGCFGAGRGDYCFTEEEFNRAFEKYELGEDETLEVDIYTPKSITEFKR